MPLVTVHFVFSSCHLLPKSGSIRSIVKLQVIATSWCLHVETIHSRKNLVNVIKDLHMNERCMTREAINAIKSGNLFPPLSEGVLIADEVKVAAKLHWNSREDIIVGTSMTPDEMATLQDLYMELDEDPTTSKADYVLQTLWRDLSTNHDIIGPYYTSTGTFDAKFMLACLIDSLQYFHAFGFKVSLVIVDGAASNLLCIKLLLGRKGVFGHNDELADRHSVDVFTMNPFTGDKLYFMICPSHHNNISNTILILDL